MVLLLLLSGAGGCRSAVGHLKPSSMHFSTLLLIMHEPTLSMELIIVLEMLYDNQPGTLQTHPTRSCFVKGLTVKNKLSISVEGSPKRRFYIISGVLGFATLSPCQQHSNNHSSIMHNNKADNGSYIVFNCNVWYMSSSFLLMRIM